LYSRAILHSPADGKKKGKANEERSALPRLEAKSDESAASREGDARFKVVPIDEIFGDVLDGILEVKGVAVTEERVLRPVVEADVENGVSKGELLGFVGDLVQLISTARPRSRRDRRDQLAVQGLDGRRAKERARHT
jgi:hypothetical protein